MKLFRRYLVSAFLFMWMVQSFSTLSSVQSFLNQLPQDKAATAKVVALSSARSSWTMGITAYAVFYER